MYKKKKKSFNLKGNLKLESFDHGTFLHRVHKLLLITLQYLILENFDSSKALRCDNISIPWYHTKKDEGGNLI